MIERIYRYELEKETSPDIDIIKAILVIVEKINEIISVVNYINKEDTEE